MFRYTYDYYLNFGRTLEISNGSASVKITLDVGPRIISYSLAGRENIFFTDTARYMSNPSYESKCGTGDEWQLFGGHRFWSSPEDYDFTYDPDSSPVSYSIDRANGSAEFAAPTRKFNGLQKTIRVTLAPEGTGVTVEHFLTNNSDNTYRLAIWGVTVIDGGGVEIIPLPKAEPAEIVPYRTISLWHGSHYNDSRLSYENDSIVLTQDRNAESSFKLGTVVKGEAVVCNIKGYTFSLYSDYRENALYPDGGCNYESYTNHLLTEMETLSPLYNLAPGETVSHTERWKLSADNIG